MKSFYLSLFLLVSALSVVAQTEKEKQMIYSTSNFEFLFQDGSFDKDGKSLDTNTRFTLWFNYTQQLHINFTNNVGIYTGAAIRNVGFITQNENVKVGGQDAVAETVKRRLYTLGIPLALKLGAFDRHMFIYGGGEMELAIAYKEKRWIDGGKSKKTDWFGSQTDRFLPSVFAGIQFPRGINVQYKRYLNDFLRPEYGAGTDYDQSGFTKTALQYLSISFTIDPYLWGAKSESSNTKNL